MAHVKRLFSVCIFSCKKNEYTHTLTIYIVIMIKLNESRDCVPDFINPSTHLVYCVFEWNGVWLAQWQCRHHQRKKDSKMEAEAWKWMLNQTTRQPTSSGCILTTHIQLYAFKTHFKTPNASVTKWKQTHSPQTTWINSYLVLMFMIILYLLHLYFYGVKGIERSGTAKIFLHTQIYAHMPSEYLEM